jgi:hypothetical protein
MACDVDEQLFVVLSAVIPTSYAYMRANVERDAPIGGKFSALCLVIEGEVDFLKEHSSQTSTVSFLDTSREHIANVALSSRIAKDPRGEPLNENKIENYSKTVSIEYDSVMALQPDNNPYFENLWDRVLTLEANAAVAIAPRKSRSPRRNSRSLTWHDRHARRERSRSPRGPPLREEHYSRDRNLRHEYDRGGGGKDT